MRIRPAGRLLAAIAGAIAVSAAVSPTAAAAADTTPPSTPTVIYAWGYQCLEMVVGFTRSTDDVTPQRDLRYEVFANGEFVGWIGDYGQNPNPYGSVYAVVPGANNVTIQAVDAAGNRSATSNAQVAEPTLEPFCTG